MTTSPNSCRPSYRGLTPTQECHLRSMRLGIIERPGALPGHGVSGGGRKMRDDEHRFRVINGIRAGMTSRSQIGVEFGNAAYGVIDALVAEGKILETKDGCKRSYAVAS